MEPRGYGPPCFFSKGSVEMRSLRGWRCLRDSAPVVLRLVQPEIFVSIKLEKIYGDATRGQLGGLLGANTD